MSPPVKDTPPTFAEQQMLEKQRRYSQLLEDEGSDDVAGYRALLGSEQATPTRLCGAPHLAEPI